MAKGRLAGALFCLCAAVALLLPATALAAEPDWTGWTKLTSSDTNLSAGKYYLEGDVTIESTIEINGAVTLDLNGHVLKKTGDFTLRDSRAGDEDAKHYFTVGDDGLWTLTDEVTESVVVGGVITGGRNLVPDYEDADTLGGAVYNLGAFTMEGGSISGCAAHEGDAVCNEGRIDNGSLLSATICYGELCNRGSIDGCLVEFKDGEGLYA